MAFGKQGASPRALCCQFSHSNIYFWPSLVSADFKFFFSRLCQSFGAIVQSALSSELACGCHPVWMLHGAVPLTAETDPTAFPVQDWGGEACSQ